MTVERIGMNSLQDAVGWLDDGTPTSRVPRLRKREGRCYELALRGCLKASEWELVHGECIDKFGNRIGHAWLEFDGESYCPVWTFAWQVCSSTKSYRPQPSLGIR
jgi:hypothetical protein